MARLLEFLQILSIDQVTELILNADNKFDRIERVKTVVWEGGVKSDRCLARSSKVVLDYGDNVLFNLVVTLQNESLFLRVNLLFPQFEVGVFAGLIPDGNRFGIETQIFDESAALHASESEGSSHGGLGAHEWVSEASQHTGLIHCFFLSFRDYQ